MRKELIFTQDQVDVIKEVRDNLVVLNHDQMELWHGRITRSMNINLFQLGVTTDALARVLYSDNYKIEYKFKVDDLVVDEVTGACFKLWEDDFLFHLNKYPHIFTHIRHATDADRSNIKLINKVKELKELEKNSIVSYDDKIYVFLGYEEGNGEFNVFLNVKHKYDSNYVRTAHLNDGHDIGVICHAKDRVG